jgi:hypothetical protein
MATLPLEVINIPVLSGIDELTPFTLSLAKRADGNFAATLLDNNNIAVPNAVFFFKANQVAITGMITSSTM